MRHESQQHWGSFVHQYDPAAVDMAKIIKMHPSGNQGENDKNAPTSPIADFLNFLHSEMQNGHKSTLFDNEDEFDDNDEFNDNDEGLLDDEAYLIGEKLPKQKFLGKSVREFHIRIKLNYAPTKIWRELVVPSNITLELLAYVLIQAMGWHHEHLFQFKGKHDTYYINSREFKEHRDSFFGFHLSITETAKRHRWTWCCNPKASG